MASVEEISFRRLLGRCEGMAKSLKEEDEWRLNKYIEYLDELIINLKASPNKPDNEVMNTYIQRLSFLKGILHVHKEEAPLDKMIALQLATKGNNNEDSKELQHFTNEAVGSKLREELLTKKSGNLRRRKTTGDSHISAEATNDLDTLLKYHHTMQEKIADDMLVLARNIKEQSVLAGNIIRNDSKVVEKSSSLADKNIDQLKVHSDKLQENNKKTWQCWTWVLLIVVIVIFINMILLMKVMKKRTS